MTPKTKLASGWGIASIIIAIAAFLLTNVLASKPEIAALDGRVKGLEEFRMETKADLREIKSDVKVLLQRIPEKR
jgi:hypothetical protein